jgi:shikimate dehydrogenase
MTDSDNPAIQKENPAITPVPEATDIEEQRPEAPSEVGGPPGLEPTRYGDWEKAGRCIDF